MKLPILLCAMAALATATPAMASDARVRSLLFNPSKVVQFVGKPGFQSTIRFAPDERIENVAVGDSVAWQVTPNKRGDLLFVKPMVAGAKSNMAVITDKRTYLFDLTAPRGAQPVYALSFDYPEFPAPGAIAPPPAAAPAVPVAVVQVPAPVVPPKFNFGWVIKGSRSLAPARAFDDGRSLFIGWPDNKPLPAVLVAASEGVEGPIDYRMENGFIVVDTIPSELILRRGKEVVTVTAAKPDSRTLRTAAVKGAK
ncbi:MAG TPA: TrbG/VirB9 family P-type conjugative transfer protein [Sphingomicrobium sp.]|nr:TrbG/VirB9 family P-type conjugative transfer protein [Sphingomicrobium sp.]